MEGGIIPIHMLDPEVQDYYWKVSKGQIEERSYDSWGPESEEETAYWKQWWHAMPVLVPFRRIFWDSGFTGRGIKKTKKRNMERLDLVGPKGERLELDTSTINPDKPIKRAATRSPKKSTIRKLADIMRQPYGHTNCQ